MALFQPTYKYSNLAGPAKMGDVGGLSNAIADIRKNQLMKREMELAAEQLQWKRDDRAEAKEQKADTKTLLDRAATAMPAYALASNTTDRDIINTSAVNAWDRTIAANPALAKKQADLRAKQDAGTASYGDVEAFRNEVMGTKIGDMRLDDTLNQHYKAYVPYQKEAGRALGLAARDLNIDPTVLLGLTEKIQGGYASEADTKKAFADTEQQRYKNAIEKEKLLLSATKTNNTGKGSRSSSKYQGYKPGQVAKSAQALRDLVNADEGSNAWFGEVDSNDIVDVINKDKMASDPSSTLQQYAKSMGIPEGIVYDIAGDAVEDVKNKGFFNTSSGKSAVKVRTKQLIDAYAKDRDRYVEGRDSGRTKVEVSDIPLPKTAGSLTDIRRDKIVAGLDSIFPDTVANTVTPKAVVSTKPQKRADILASTKHKKQPTSKKEPIKLTEVDAILKKLDSAPKRPVPQGPTTEQDGFISRIMNTPSPYSGDRRKVVESPYSNFTYTADITTAMQQELADLKKAKALNPNLDTDNRIEAKLHNELLHRPIVYIPDIGYVNVANEGDTGPVPPKTTVADRAIMRSIEAAQDPAEWLRVFEAGLMAAPGASFIRSMMGLPKSTMIKGVAGNPATYNAKQVVAKEAEIANRINQLRGKKALKGTRPEVLEYKPLLPTQPIYNLNGKITKSEEAMYKEWLRVNAN